MDTDADLEDSEVQPPLRRPGPRVPSASEVSVHEDQGHVQYRSWRRWCVASRDLQNRTGP